MTHPRVVAPLWSRIVGLIALAVVDAFFFGALALITTLMVRALVGWSVALLVWPIAIALWLGRF